MLARQLSLRPQPSLSRQSSTETVKVGISRQNSIEDGPWFNVLIQGQTVEGVPVAGPPAGVPLQTFQHFGRRSFHEFGSADAPADGTAALQRSGSDGLRLTHPAGMPMGSLPPPDAQVQQRLRPGPATRQVSLNRNAGTALSDPKQLPAGQKLWHLLVLL
eukprot:SM000077S21568  [mRNA]  locus=s77:170963:171742:- [translate_table: standard]